MPFKFVAFWFLSMSIDSRHGMKRSPVSLYFLESKLANAAVVSQCKGGRIWQKAKPSVFKKKKTVSSVKKRDFLALPYQ